jgi:UDP-3-O-[3-hydroxymyristoyl] glucosamine N-acyltransferase
MNIQELLNSIAHIDFLGNREAEIKRVAPFDPANTDAATLMWVNEKRAAAIGNCRTGTLIVPSFDRSLVQPGCNYIMVEHPRAAFAAILKKWFTQPRPKGISASARVHASTVVGVDVYIGENVVVESGCVIGDRCSIGHNTVLISTRLEADVSIGCNCTIGGAGFGYEKNKDGMQELMPHLGGVFIQHHAEIGNNTCIDRAVMGDTVIGAHVKIDNLVHIAHGVTIGENTLVIAHAMIGGSTSIGKNVWIAPAASLINKTGVGDDAVVGMGAVVIRPVDPGQVVAGNPAKPLE